MIFTKELKTFEDFDSIKRGDFLACEFHRDVNDNPKKYRFNVFKVADNKDNCSEIILQHKNNIYFNYAMFLDPDESSNLKRAVLIYRIDYTDELL